MADIKARAVLCDIEGTTTSVKFVTDVLFPYAKKHTKQYLKDNWLSTPLGEVIGELWKLPQYVEYLGKRVELVPENIEKNVDQLAGFVNYLIDKDLKLGPLKKLQGYVWEAGFESGELKGHVFDDVPVAFQQWQDADLCIAIYSSGSVKAQKLLFAHTEKGNLLPYICDHFDTSVGHKQDHQSYINIASHLHLHCADIVFLTDVAGEAVAARKAGMQAVILSREGNNLLTDDEKADFLVANDFTSFNIKLK